MTNWQEEGKKLNKGLAEILKQSTANFDDKSVEEFELIYQNVCSEFKKFLRYYRLMGNGKYLNRNLLFGVQFGVILIKKFGGTFVNDDSGDATAEIKIKSINGDVTINPWNIISDSLDSEDRDGNKRTIEQICIELGISNGSQPSR